jgi:hypothetical protein
MRRGGIQVAIVCALMLAGAAPANAGLFAPDSFVNKPLPSTAPLDPNSSTMVTALRLEVQREAADPDVRNRPNINTWWCSPRVYTVPAAQPTVKVDIVGASALDPNLQQQFAAVPIPPGAREDENCTDRNLVIHQPSTDKMWEFWVMNHDAATDKWSARYGGEIGPEDTGMLGLSQSPGYWTDRPTGFGHRYGATGTSIPLLAGLQTTAELQAGNIDHSIAFAMRSPAACWRFPAQRQDGDLSGSNSLAPPEGAILRLPASLNITSLNLPHYTAMVARAVQRYGMHLRDRAAHVAFYAEHPQADSPDPYAGPGGVFQGVPGDQLMAKFPWDKLQVLAVAPGHSACQTQ